MQLSCLSNRRLLQQKGADALLKRVGDVSAARAPQQGPSLVWLLGTTPQCHPSTPFFLHHSGPAWEVAAPKCCFPEGERRWDQPK